MEHLVHVLSHILKSSYAIASGLLAVSNFKVGIPSPPWTGRKKLFLCGGKGGTGVHNTSPKQTLLSFETFKELSFKTSKTLSLGGREPPFTS